VIRAVKEMQMAYPGAEKQTTAPRHFVISGQGAKRQMQSLSSTGA
jgi:hypothetical protein